jgi:hypothetical protein
MRGRRTSERRDSRELTANVAAVASRISESSKNDLVHYVALRRQVLELFKKKLGTRSQWCIFIRDGSPRRHLSH